MPREFGKYLIPISIQSCYLRDYARRNGYSYSLPVTEFCIPLCYKGLDELIQKACKKKDLNTNINLAICSAYMVQEISRKSAIYNLISKENIIFHCILENMVGSIDEVFQLLDSANKYDGLALDSGKYMQ